MTKIRPFSYEEKIQFLLEELQDFAEAAIHYGSKINKPGEEQAAQEFEDANDRIHKALYITLETENE